MYLWVVHVHVHLHVHVSGKKCVYTWATHQKALLKKYINYFILKPVYLYVQPKTQFEDGTWSV